MTEEINTPARLTGIPLIERYINERRDTETIILSDRTTESGNTSFVGMLRFNGIGRRRTPIKFRAIKVILIGARNDESEASA